MYQTILYEVKDQVATISVNRPEFSNAFARETYDEIRDAVEKSGKDDAVRVVVITGTGKNFSAGGDIKRFKMLIEQGTGLPRDGVLAAGAMSRAIRKCPKPIVAKINGAAAGAGCSLALACDFRVMEPKSKLGMSFINMGFSGDTGIIYFLRNIVGIAKTTELMALGIALGGKEALDLGLTTRLAEEGKLEEETDKLVAELLGKPTYAIGLQKDIYYTFFHNDMEKFTEMEADYMVATSKSQDHKEAVSAFLEKRKPTFTGK